MHQIQTHTHDSFAEPKALGLDLKDSINQVMNDIEGCSMRPTDLARRLNVSRVMISRLVNAIAKPDPVETLSRIPGPETLRSIVRAASQAGVSADQTTRALQQIDQFDRLIRDQYGTRSAMNAALSSQSEQAREQFEQSSRYQVYKGMSQIVGAQSSLWITAMLLTQNESKPDGIDISTIHGTSGLRRLRPDTPIRFFYGIPPEYIDSRQSPQRKDDDVNSFTVHQPAPLTVEQENGQIINTFAPESDGKDALYDMFSEVYIPNGSNRYASHGRTMRGTTVIPDVPVITLVSDVILCDGIFDEITPELFVYNTMPRGGADIEDPNRELDRMTVGESIESIDVHAQEFGLQGFPKYVDMLRYLCEKNERTIDSARVWRLRVQYPVFGFQYTLGFKVPPQPVTD